MKKFLVLIFVLIFSVSLLFSQDEESEDWFYEEAEKAIEKENYEYALSVLNRGIVAFPDSFLLREKTGDLYFDKELYSLALESYRSAEEIDGERDSVIYNIGTTLGRLNENNQAITYFEKLLEYDSYHRRAVDDLSWLYYKVHRLEESEALLLEEIERSFHRNYAITLGTVYSDMYRYDLSKQYYQMSIDDALERNAHYFASVALYNLSLLEYSFYNYEESFRYTGESLDQRDRSSGHLARGEILQLAGRYRESEEEYLKAESMDSTPLSRIALGGLYQKAGHLEKALAYMKDVEARRDMSWMYFFGTDKEQYAMDLNGPLSNIYQSKAVYEKRRLTSGPLDWFQSLFKWSKYRILSFYHDQLYRRAARTVGDNNSGKSDLNSWWAYSRASLGNRSAFMKYIEKCEAFERNLSDKSIPWYLLEKGRELKDRSMLEEALTLFRPQWEGEPIMETLQHYIPLVRDDVIRREQLNKLYDMNPGALFQHDLSLPVVLEISGAGNRRIVQSYLRKTGFELSDRSGEGFSKKLIINISENKWRWYFLDENGANLYEGEQDVEKMNRESYKQLVMSIVNSLFSYSF